MISGEPIPVAAKAGRPGDRWHGQRHRRPGCAGRARRGRYGSRTDRPHGEPGAADPRPIQRLADQVSAYFVPSVVLIAVVTFIAWVFVGPEPRMAHGLVSAVAVLIIACPCALGLATPMSIMVGTGRGAAAGVLVKNAEALEILERVDTLVVDKTGTLTEGKPRLVSIVPAFGFDESELLRLAASLEQASEHPLAAATVRAALEKALNLSSVQAFQSRTGRGALGQVDGRNVAIGNHALLQELAVAPGTLESQADDLRRDGQTVVFVVIDRRPAGLLGIADPVKESAIDALSDLRREGIRLIMLTGDTRATAEAVSRRLGLDEVRAEVLPDQKAQAIERLQAEGRIVAMAGDGINDAPAARSGPGGHRHGHRHRCRHGKCRHHALERRLAGNRPRPTPQPRHHDQHPPEPRLRLPLQRPGRANRGRRPLSRVRNLAEPDDRQPGHDLELGLRDRERAAAEKSEALVLLYLSGSKLVLQWW